MLLGLLGLGFLAFSVTYVGHGASETIQPFLLAGFVSAGAAVVLAILRLVTRARARASARR